MLIAGQAKTKKPTLKNNRIKILGATTKPKNLD